MAIMVLSLNAPIVYTIRAVSLQFQRYKTVVQHKLYVVFNDYLMHKTNDMQHANRMD